MRRREYRNGGRHYYRNHDDNKNTYIKSPFHISNMKNINVFPLPLHYVLHVIKRIPAALLREFAVIIPLYPKNYFFLKIFPKIFPKNALFFVHECSAFEAYAVKMLILNGLLKCGSRRGRSVGMRILLRHSVCAFPIVSLRSSCALNPVRPACSRGVPLLSRHGSKRPGPACGSGLIGQKVFRQGVSGCAVPPSGPPCAPCRRAASLSSSPCAPPVW